MVMRMHVELTLTELRANILRVATKLNDDELSVTLAVQELLRIAGDVRDIELTYLPCLPEK